VLGLLARLMSGVSTQIRWAFGARMRCTISDAVGSRSLKVRPDLFLTHNEVRESPVIRKASLSKSAVVGSESEAGALQIMIFSIARLKHASTAAANIPT
jgi:hypothetical protein